MEQSHVVYNVEHSHIVAYERHCDGGSYVELFQVDSDVKLSRVVSYEKQWH